MNQLRLNMIQEFVIAMSLEIRERKLFFFEFYKNKKSMKLKKFPFKNYSIIKQ